MEVKYFYFCFFRIQFGNIFRYQNILGYIFKNISEFKSSGEAIKITTALIYLMKILLQVKGHVP